MVLYYIVIIYYGDKCEEGVAHFARLKFRGGRVMHASILGGEYFHV